jgi:hypothetical protein
MTLVAVFVADQISVTVTPPATWLIGPQALNYVGESGTFTVNNDGNVAEDIAINAGDGAGGWLLQDAVGADAFKVEADGDANGVYELILGKIDQTLYSNLDTGGAKGLKLRYSAPNADTKGGGVAQDFTITITASRHTP